MRSHTRMKSAFFFDRTTAPSWSSRCSRKTSISSPSLRACASLNSSIGTAPSDLNPTSRMTAVSVTRRTFDLTISPSSMLRSEEHTSELQSRLHLVCRLLLEKKKKQIYHIVHTATHRSDPT